MGAAPYLVVLFAIFSLATSSSPYLISSGISDSEAPSPELPVSPSPPTPFIPVATLANISVSNGGKFIPDFEPNHFSYRLLFGSDVRYFTITVHFPASEQAENYYEASIDSVPLKSGIPSSLLKLGKRGEITPFNIFVMVVNHKPSIYQLMASRDTHLWRGFIEKTLSVLGILAAFIAGCYLCYIAYSYYFATKVVDPTNSSRGSIYRPILS
eukprot:TRINITY_DN3507_c0_g1_i1.p1 TRINITY_DN3507_c0_g1~~TRINITY_DN3507_c0_g1_i1.p1  ORF type:complete len:212 (+),score=3.90 TRINITY_DN3507_c0_g1_i1:384-1019(+)